MARTLQAAQTLPRFFLGMPHSDRERTDLIDRVSWAVRTPRSLSVSMASAGGDDVVLTPLARARAKPRWATPLPGFPFTHRALPPIAASGASSRAARLGPLRTCRLSHD